MFHSVLRRVIGLTVFALLVTVLQVSAAQADENAPIDLLCDDAALATDVEDASADVVLPFAVDIGDGAVETPTMTISENGIVGFGGGPTEWFDAFDLEALAQGDTEIVAPLFAEATTGAAGSVTYGAAVYEGRDAFCVNWTDMEPFTADAGITPDPVPTNSFQLVLVNRSDVAAGAFDIIVNYEQVEWDDSYCPQGGFDGPVELRQINGACCLDAEELGCCPQFDIELGCCPQFDIELGCCNVFDPQLGCCEFDVRTCCAEFDICPPGLAGLRRSVFDDANGESAAGHAGVVFPSGGFSTAVVAFPGTGDVDGMVGADGLAGQSLNSLQAGRYIVAVRNGFQDDLSTVVGSVEDAAGDPIEDVIVSVCTEQDIDEEEIPQRTTCGFATTDANGEYTVPGVPVGTYRISARAPAALDLFDEFIIHAVRGGDFSFAATMTMTGPIPVPDGVGFGPTSQWAQNTTVYYGEQLTLTVPGCAGGTGTWSVVASYGPDVNGTLTEGPAGTYTGVIPPLRPTHGEGEVTTTITCPDGSEEDTVFSVYIDPAGVILEVDSGELIEGATVVLERRDVGASEWTVVPDGDLIMSSKNRVNPFTTNESGEFSWDVIAGEYRVTASKAGCDSIALPPEWADAILTETSQIIGVPNASVTPALTVDPEWLDLELYLDCNNAPTISVADVILEAPADASDVDNIPTDTDDLDAEDVAGLVVTNDAPAELPLGDTTITWTVEDDEGATGTTTSVVTVEDTTAPVITVPASVEEVSPDGNPVAVTFEASALDAYDGAVDVTCDPASGTDFAVGLTTVTCSASDAEGNSDSESFGVGVSQVAVGDVRGEVAAIADLLSDTSGFDRADRWRANRARWYLTYADNDRYWRDNNQVTDRNGARALFFMRIAVSYMSSIDDLAVEGATLDLLDNMRTLATNKIDEAVATPGLQWLIERANVRVSVGDTRVSQDLLGSAGNNYRQAWGNAVVAIRRAP